MLKRGRLCGNIKTTRAETCLGRPLGCTLLHTEDKKFLVGRMTHFTSRADMHSLSMLQILSM